MEKFSALLSIDKRPKSINEIQKILLKLPIIINNYRNNLKNNSDIPKQEDLSRLYAIKKTTSRVSNARLICKDYIDLTYLNDAYGYLYQIKELRSGNCLENAVLAELILKLNGIENARLTQLKAYNSENPCARLNIDHIVCAFNDDGSNVDRVSRKTIIIDPWLNKADYAENMKLFYKNIGEKYLDLRLENPTIIFSTPTEEIKINENEKIELLALYPKLQFKSSSRKFMQKKAPQ